MAHLSRTLQFLPAAWNTHSKSRPKAWQWRKNSASGAHGCKEVVEKAKPVLRGEERRIIQSALAGDSDALSTLFARNRMKLFRTAFSLLRNKQDAEDALQDGLLCAYLKLSSFEGLARFSTWLTRIVINSALMNRRKLHAHPRASLDQILASDAQHGIAVALAEDPDPEQDFAHVENRAAFEKKMNQLSPPLQSALRLRYLQHLSTREAAKAESVKTSVLKSRVFRARKQLGSLFEVSDVNL